MKGYDACGIASMGHPDSKEIAITKHAQENRYGGDCLLKLANSVKEIHNSGLVGIAHTRWATHGSKTDTNAHPHTD